MPPARIVIVTRQEPADRPAAGTNAMLLAARHLKNQGVSVAVTSLRGLQKKLLPYTNPGKYPFALLYTARDTLLKATTNLANVAVAAPSLKISNMNVNSSKVETEMYTLIQARNPRSTHRRKMILLVRGIVTAGDRSLAAFRRLIRLAKRRRKSAIAVAEVSAVETPPSLQSVVTRMAGKPFAVVLDLQQFTLHNYVPHFQGIYETPRALANLKYHFLRTRI